MDVTTELTGRGLERLQRGPEASAIALRGLTIRGAVERVDRDSLLLLVSTTVVRGDFLAQTLSQRVQLAHSEVNSAQVRRLDRGRTAVVALGVAVLSYVVVSRLQEGAGARGGSPLPGGPPESRVPLGVRWSIW